MTHNKLVCPLLIAIRKTKETREHLVVTRIARYVGVEVIVEDALAGSAQHLECEKRHDSRTVFTTAAMDINGATICCTGKRLVKRLFHLG